ncbi:MAG: PadR family transcriptional regulator [Proteobacteria bacterium]|nr:MAG: PadR family transcriptional regulator [Pseudomonadota bacterium]
MLRGSTPTLVLAVLADTPQHGYGIAREINRRSGDALKCKQGTLYPALHALERDGMIVGEWDTSERPRKVYALTEAGHAELARRLKTWQTFSRIVADVTGNVESPREEPAG